ncbi:rhomboid-related protein 1 isoform X10 [Felis catus]|uniref:rhomboid-related protein 1 isoform X10 n=1 Tax=Felis catus TaxID=9685 RepID=UPI001D19983C|nr:rhomboid-related protein 1 isoform X10 [Felis catus]
MDRSSLLQLIQEQEDGQGRNEAGRPLRAVGAEGLGPRHWCPGGSGDYVGTEVWSQGAWSLPLPAGLTHPQALAGGPPPPQQLDPENTGFIGADTFTGLVHSHELPLDPAKLDMLVALAQSNERGQVCYQELVDLISSKRSSSFKRAIANGQRALPRDGLLDEPGLGVYKRFVRYVAYEILPREVDRHWYFYRHRSCPPPVFMASVTLAQIIVFLCYGARLNKWVLQTYHPEYMKSPLVYHPGHRARAWRFLTYMFMHVGLPDCLHYRHAGPCGGGLWWGLRLVLGTPGQRRHELGWDEVSLQAAEDGAGLGVHELRGGPGRVAPLFPTAACLRPTAQLHGTPGRCSGRGQHGSDHPAQL